MPSLTHLIRTKGLSNTLKRVGMIYRRYSFGAYLKSLNAMINLLSKYDANVTFPITSVTLRRNARILRRYIESDMIEWAMHGYIHTDYTKLSIRVVDEHIRKGKEIFSELGIELTGFRAPYLKVNDNIISLLSHHGFLYDSSRSFFVGLIPHNQRDIKRILSYYSPMKTWKIEKKFGIAEIPVCLPDDEMLADRLGYRSEKIGRIWIEMCKKVRELGGVTVMQIHPERGRLCLDALRMVLQWCSENDVNSVKLHEISITSRENMLAVTGDIDVIKLSDFRYMRHDI